MTPTNTRNRQCKGKASTINTKHSVRIKHNASTATLGLRRREYLRKADFPILYNLRLTLLGIMQFTLALFFELARNAIKIFLCRQYDKMVTHNYDHFSNIALSIETGRTTGPIKMDARALPNDPNRQDSTISFF